MAQFAREQEARPEVIAHEEARHADEGLRARHRADSLGQKTRLLKAGWLCVRAGEGLGLGSWGHPGEMLRMQHTLFREDDGGIWSHASFSLHGTPRQPSWEHMRDAHWALYPGLYGMQVVAPQDKHVDISQAVHVWTCLTAVVVPDFGRFGTI